MKTTNLQFNHVFSLGCNVLSKYGYIKKYNYPKLVGDLVDSLVYVSNFEKQAFSDIHSDYFIQFCTGYAIGLLQFQTNCDPGYLTDYNAKMMAFQVKSVFNSDPDFSKQLAIANDIQSAFSSFKQTFKSLNNITLQEVSIYLGYIVCCNDNYD